MPKEIHGIPTHTTLKGEMAEDVIRTIVCREVGSDPKNDQPLTELAQKYTESR